MNGLLYNDDYTYLDAMTGKYVSYDSILSYDNMRQVDSMIIGFNHNSDLEGKNLIHFQLCSYKVEEGRQPLVLSHYDGYSVNYDCGDSLTAHNDQPTMWMDNSSEECKGWITSAMKIYTMPAIETLLEEELTSVVKTVKKYSYDVDSNSMKVSDERFFLPSIKEIGVSNKASMDGDDTKSLASVLHANEYIYTETYEFYKNLSYTAKFGLVCEDGIVNKDWSNWTRTKTVEDNTYILYWSGDPSVCKYSYYEGISPCFCV